MFFRSKSAPEAQSEEKSVFAQARDFEAVRIDLVQKSEARAWMTAKLLGGVCAALVVSIVAMMPLKETLPYVVQYDKTTGMTEVLTIANERSVPTSEIMDKYWLAEYVRSRETYDWRTLENDFIKTRELSLPNVFEPYARQFGEEKNSLESRLKDSKRILVTLKSVVPNGNGIATVRFEKVLINNSNGETEARDGWTATIGYEYVPSFKVTEAKRLINPFGFKVTSYRVDPELGGSVK